MLHEYDFFNVNSDLILLDYCKMSCVSNDNTMNKLYSLLTVGSGNLIIQN